MLGIGDVIDLSDTHRWLGSLLLLNGVPGVSGSNSAVPTEAAPVRRQRDQANLGSNSTIRSSGVPRMYVGSPHGSPHR